MTRLLLAALLLPLTLSLGTQQLRAQQPGAPAPGDYFWAFAPRGPFADDRVVLAFALLVDTSGVPDTAGVDGALRYGDEGVIEFTNEKDASEAELLFAAAGLANPAEDLTPVRACRFWTPTGIPEDEARIAVGAALGAAIADALRDLGLEVAPCVFTEESGDADVYLWEFGQDTHVELTEPDLFGDSFLQIAELRDHDAGTSSDVSPPTTGDAGLR